MVVLFNQIESVVLEVLCVLDRVISQFRLEDEVGVTPIITSLCIVFNSKGGTFGVVVLIFKLVQTNFPVNGHLSILS